MKHYSEEFTAAKKETQSWLGNDVYHLVDKREVSDMMNYVTGRWVLTVKRDRAGHFHKAKARWALRGNIHHCQLRGRLQSVDIPWF
eukprot:3994610-Amphidinium_carterae.1